SGMGGRAGSVQQPQPVPDSFLPARVRQKSQKHMLCSLGTSFAVAGQQARLGACRRCVVMTFRYMRAWALFLKTQVPGMLYGNHGPISAAVPSPPAPAAQAMA